MSWAVLGKHERATLQTFVLAFFTGWMAQIDIFNGMLQLEAPFPAYSFAQACEFCK
jgi:hypothetical protein